jgi:hypothetical protein
MDLMYRDDELTVTLQIQKAEEKLSAKLEKPLRQLRYWRHSHLHPLVITLLFYLVIFSINLIWGSDPSEHPIRWYKFHTNAPLAVWLGPLIAVIVSALFLTLQWLLVKRRVNRFYSLYGPPPKNLKPMERLHLLKGRLEELQALSQIEQQGE